jgi:SAM-dependent methyltransferase
MEPREYDAELAEHYDEWQPPLSADHPAIRLLSELAHGGRLLELGIGTGRFALPLAASGIDVHGIDLSEPMVAKLRAKPGGEAIPVVMGDFADVPVEGDFALIFAATHTFFVLPDQAAQVRCFRNVAKHLTPDGLFLLEVYVPDAPGYGRDETVRTFWARHDGVMLAASQHDRVQQRVFTQQMLIAETGVTLFPEHLRYAWPAEIDLMAQLAGLTLRHRWGGWQRQPFTGASTIHISVYGRP